MFKCVRIYDRPGYYEGGFSDYLGRGDRTEKGAAPVPGGTRILGPIIKRGGKISGIFG